METGVRGKTVLVAEDEPEVRNYLEMALRCQGYRVECAQDGEDALVCLNDSADRFSVVILDVLMPRKDGLETLREIRRIDPGLPVIMLSGASSPLNVVEAMKSGATDFLGKPVSHDELGLAIQKVLRLDAEVLPGPPHSLGQANGDLTFLPTSVRMKRIQTTLQRVGASDVPVLLLGESGVGKEVLARQLHALSLRAGKPFLKINCAAMPSELLESELFGYERGAFTGAFKNKPGKFELADGGTILLDEIGDMDFKLQAKLLQVLQDNEFHRLGGKDMVSVDVRVMAATHCDLEKAMREGLFREDLYYRLNVISIHIPALRERKDEILPLAAFFLKKHGSPDTLPPEITPALKQALLNHDWPGNIRELENVMRKLLVLRDPDCLSQELRFSTRKKRAVPGGPFATPEEQPAVVESPSPAPMVEETRQAQQPPETAESPLSLEGSNGSCNTAVEVQNRNGHSLLDKIKKLVIEDNGVPAALPVNPLLPEPEVAAEACPLEKVDMARRQLEIEAILAALHSSHWNRRRAASLLNIEYKALLYKMKKLEIEDKVNLPPGSLELPLNGDGSLAVGSVLERVGEARKQAETEAILAALQSTRWNRKRAAALLDVDYKALLYKMKKLGIGENSGRPSQGDLPPTCPNDDRYSGPLGVIQNTD